MTLLVFIYVYRIDMNIERLMPCSNKHNLHLKNILSSNNKSKQQSTFKSKQQSMTSCRCKYNAQYNLQLSLSCFLLMLLTERFCIYFCQLHQSSSQLLVENTPISVLPYPVYRYTSSTHGIYIFTFTLIYFNFSRKSCDVNISKDSWLGVRFCSSATEKKRRYSERKTISLPM